jgi:hypothetical protein
MAYSASITVTKVGHANVEKARQELFVVQIDETEAAAASEAEIDLAAEGLPFTGRIVARQIALIGGTGTTVSPLIGSVTDPATNSLFLFSFGGTAAATVREQPTKPIVYYSAGSLFHRSVVDAAADNVIRTVYYIAAGWGL